jgi:hypothetical protein
MEEQRQWRKESSYPRNPLSRLFTSLSKTTTGISSVLLEVIEDSDEEPSDGFLVVVALLAFNDDLAMKMLSIGLTSK